jgi:excisionase family DNA binding protein
VADPPKITLDDLIAHPDRADHIADDQVRDVLREIAERTSALGSLQSQIMWRLVSLRHISAEGFPPLMNAKKLADHLAVPESWIREQTRIGELPSIKLGHYVRFRLDDVQRHISRLAGSHVNASVGADVPVPGSAASTPSRQVQRPRGRPQQHE